MPNYESPEVVFNGSFYQVGEWSFDVDDADLAYIDRALDSWSRWRDYVAEGKVND